MNKVAGPTVIVAMICTLVFMAIFGIIAEVGGYEQSLVSMMPPWMVYWIGAFVATLGAVLGGCD